MSLQILLHNYNGTYYPGDSVEGVVVCTLRNQEDIRGIILKFRGREHTEWNRRESYYDSHEKKTKHKTVHYRGDNKFVENQLSLKGQGVVGPGRLEYPFKFLLPKQAPGSYSSSYGHIRYYLKGNMDIPWASDCQDEINFNVSSSIDFNEMPGLEMNPVQYEDDKNICCCCCKSGPITMRLYLDREAYVLGEMMRIKIEVINMSNESITQLNAILKKTVMEKVTYPSHNCKYDEELLTYLSDSGVGAHGERIYNLEMLIPNSVVLRNFSMCTLFQQWCTLTIEGIIPGFHSNIEVSTRITLGHIPLRGQEMIQNPQIQEVTHNAIFPPDIPFPPRPYDSNSQPPPYSSTDQAPPYPVGPIGFSSPPKSPVAVGGLGENIQSTKFPDLPRKDDIPGVHMPTPGSAPYPPGPSANAPLEETAPSAPTKAEMAENPYTSNESESPLLPSYSEALKGTTVYPPSAPK